MIIGHQRQDAQGTDATQLRHAQSEGYRKALRLMRLAENSTAPSYLIDTPGAYPGIGAEERGQAEAIARNLFVMSV